MVEVEEDGLRPVPDAGRVHGDHAEGRGGGGGSGVGEGHPELEHEEGKVPEAVREEKEEVKSAAEYEIQWEECESVEQMNLVFARVIRSYSALEDRVKMAEVIIDGVRDKVLGYRKR